MKIKTNTKVNRGFSYIELIVVISILGIMVGMAALSFSIVTRNNTTKTAAKLESVFNKARTITMAKGTKKGSIELSFEDGKWYYYIGDPGIPESKKTKEKFAQTPINVQLVTEHGNVSELSEIGHYCFKFNRSTGGLKNDEFTAVRISNGSTVADVTISELTGNVEVVLR